MEVPSLVLPARALADVRRWAQQAYPAEGCGLLVGPWPGAAVAVEVRRVVSTPNLAPPGALDRFEVDPAAHLATQREARAEGLDVIGVWHSHPDHPARPSARDAAAALAGWSYLIVAVEAGVDREAASFRFDGQVFGEQRIVSDPLRPARGGAGAPPPPPRG
ncbi:MAG: M67 family metallopeptidase [Planctomycetota bacterium]